MLAASSHNQLFFRRTPWSSSWRGSRLPVVLTGGEGLTAVHAGTFPGVGRGAPRPVNGVPPGNAVLRLHTVQLS